MRKSFSVKMTFWQSPCFIQAPFSMAYGISRIATRSDIDTVWHVCFLCSKPMYGNHVSPCSCVHASGVQAIWQHRACKGPHQTKAVAWEQLSWWLCSLHMLAILHFAAGNLRKKLFLAELWKSMQIRMPMHAAYAVSVWWLKAWR